MCSPTIAFSCRYVGRVIKFEGTEERHVGRRRVLVAKVRARWPQTVDFEKGEFVNKPEEEELVLWPSNYGARNKRDQVRAAPAPRRTRACVFYADVCIYSTR